MNRKNIKTKTKSGQTIKPSKRLRRLKSLKEQRDQGAGSAADGDIGQVVTRYELDGVAIFAILPSQLDRMHPTDADDLFDAAEASTWRLTLQTAKACYVLRLSPNECKRALLEEGRREATQSATADESNVNPTPRSPE